MNSWMAGFTLLKFACRYAKLWICWEPRTLLHIRKNKRLRRQTKIWRNNSQILQILYYISCTQSCPKQSNLYICLKCRISLIPPPLSSNHPWSDSIFAFRNTEYYSCLRTSRVQDIRPINPRVNKLLVCFDGCFRSTRNRYSNRDFCRNDSFVQFRISSIGCKWNVRFQFYSRGQCITRIFSIIYVFNFWIHILNI